MGGEPTDSNTEGAVADTMEAEAGRQLKKSPCNGTLALALALPLPLMAGRILGIPVSHRYGGLSVCQPE